MKELVYGKEQKKITVAENWNELSAYQYLQLVKLLHSGITDADVAIDKALFILSDKSLYSFLRIPTDIRERCYEHVQWVFPPSVDGQQSTVDQLITKQHLPKFRDFYGPESSFDNLSLAEFHHTELAYAEAIAGENGDAAVDELISVLYREPKKNYDRKRNKEGDIRIPFSFSECQYNIKKIKAWPPVVKQAILMWYDGCREELRLLYPEAFEGGTKEDAGLFDTMRALSGHKYGPFKDVEQMMVHIAFLEIVASINEAKEIEKQMKAQP